MDEKKYTGFETGGINSSEGFSMPKDTDFIAIFGLLLGAFGGLNSNSKVAELEKEVAELKGKMSIIERKI